MRSSHDTILKVILGICAAFVLPIIISVVSQFFTELGKERGWYDRPSEQVEGWMTALHLFVTQTWFLLTALFTSIVLIIGLCLDRLLRRPESNVRKQELPLPARLQRIEQLTVWIEEMQKQRPRLSNAGGAIEHLLSTRGSIDDLWVGQFSQAQREWWFSLYKIQLTCHISFPNMELTNFAPTTADHPYIAEIKIQDEAKNLGPKQQAELRYFIWERDQILHNVDKLIASAKSELAKLKREILATR